MVFGAACHGADFAADVFAFVFGGGFADEVFFGRDLGFLLEHGMESVVIIAKIFGNAVSGLEWISG